MSGIAAKLGGSKGTLWNYYPSKEVLFGAVLDRATAAFREQLTLTLSPDDPIETALTKFCTKFLGKLTMPESLALHRLVVGEAARFPEMGRIFYERAPWKTQELLACYLEQAAEKGLIRCDDPFAADDFAFGTREGLLPMPDRRRDAAHVNFAFRLQRARSAEEERFSARPRARSA